MRQNQKTNNDDYWDDPDYIAKIEQEARDEEAWSYLEDEKYEREINRLMNSAQCHG